MKNIVLAFLWFVLMWLNKVSVAANDGGVLWLKKDDIRKWEIHTDDIPQIITNAIDFLMWFAWLIAIIFIIIWAYKILFGSIQQDVTKWRETILMAIWGFALTILAWFIVKLVIDNFS